MGYDEGQNNMFCKLCKDRGFTGHWCTGTRNFRKKTVIDHLNSQEHEIAKAATDPNQPTVSEETKKAEERRKEAVRLGMKACFWVATQEIPNVKFKPLLAFFRHLQIPEALNLYKSRNVKYDSPDIFNQMFGELSKTIEKDLVVQLKSSPCVGVGIDESTDRSSEKHLVAVVRYITPNSEVATTFLKCVKVRDCSAVSLHRATKDIMEEYDIVDDKIVGFGSDGATVMAGEMGGVSALLKKDNPYCIFVHCICHRLHLAVSQSCKNNHMMATLQQILSRVYNYVQGSPNRLLEFQDIADLLEIDSLKFKRIFDIRWLSLGESVRAVVRNYKPLLVYLSQDAALGKPVAIGLDQQLRKYKYVALLYLSVDILNATNHLSKLFQYWYVTFSTVKSCVEDCRNILQGFLVNDGPFLSQFHEELNNDPINMFQGVEITDQAERGERQGQRIAFLAAKTEIINSLLENLQERFPQVDLLDSMQVFDPKAYPQNVAVVDNWGNDHLHTLLQHFGQAKRNVDGVQFGRIIDPISCRGEFLTFKRTVHRHRGENRQDENGNQRFHYYRPNELFEVMFGGPHGEDNKARFHSMYTLMGY